MSAMDFGNASRQRARALLAPKRPEKLQRSALTKDALRDNLIREAEQTSERFQKAAGHKPEITYTPEDENGEPKLDKDGKPIEESYTWDAFPEMLRDMARAGVGEDEPEVARPDQVKPSHLLNRQIAADQILSESFMDARPYTRGNETQAMFGAMAAKTSLEQSAQTHLGEHIARSQEMAEQEDAIQDANTMMDQLRKQAKRQRDLAGEADPKTVQKMKQTAKQRAQSQKALQQLMQQQAASNFVADAHAAAQAAAHAMKQGTEGASALFSLPGMDAGSARNLSADQQMELAEKWNQNQDLREIAKMLGRMFQDMRFKRMARARSVKVEPVGVTTGRDLQNLLPHEYTRAFMPQMKPLFMLDYSAHALLEYDMEGKVPAGKGPIIELHDGSGSMSGEPFIWASSLGLALLKMAHREKRDFAGIEFGSRSEMASWMFPRGQDPDPNEVLDYASHFFGGGTDTYIGLAEAYRICTEVPEFKTADVIIIGDGQDYFEEEDDQVCKALRDLGVRIHAISIMCPNNAYMEQAAEYVVDVLDLAGANNASDALAENLT